MEAVGDGVGPRGEPEGAEEGSSGRCAKPVNAQEEERMTEAQQLVQELSVAAEACSQRVLKEIQDMKRRLEENHAAGLLDIKSTVATWHSLIDEKETELMQAMEEAKASKLAAFAEREGVFTGLASQARQLAVDVSDLSSEELLGQGRSLLHSLSLPLAPHPSHLTAHSGLGFCSNIRDSIYHVLSLGMWVSGDDVRVGERMVVSAVGGLQPNGTFWVRRVTSDPWRQECALQHTSNSLSEVPQSCTPLEKCVPGQLCVGQFSQDGRWYRAVVTALPQPGVAKYFFLDHGGSEEAPISSLYPLPDKFRALPFQMIHVRLTTDHTINFNTREMRWRFTDHTHKKQLVADILELSDVDEAGPVYLVSLEDCTQEQPFNVGQMLVMAAGARKETGSKFGSRDVRFKEQRDFSATVPTASTTVQATPTASTTVQATPTASVTMQATPTVSAASTQAAREEERGEAAVCQSTVPDSQQPLNDEEEEEEEEEEEVNGGPSASSLSDHDEKGLATTSSPHTITNVTPSPVTQSTEQHTQPPSSQQATPSPTATQSPSTSPVSHISQHSDIVIASDTVAPGGSPDSSPAKQSLSLGSIPESSQAEPHAVPKLEPLQLSEAGGVLESNAAGNEGDVMVTEDQLNAVEKAHHPVVKTGERLEVEVATELSPEGSFWCQLLLDQEAEASYSCLQDDLQTASDRAEGEAFTPVFYSEGDMCVAQFSEDGNWYRARIERVISGMPHVMFQVRYVDFGNSEERQQHQLILLGSKFKLLPPRAVHCNLATSDHTSFSPAEGEKFDELTQTDGIYIEVLTVGTEEGERCGPVAVRVLQSLTGGEPRDMLGQITSTTDKSKMVRRQWSSSTDIETQTTPHVSDWASHMEEEQEDSVFLTLPGHESSREATPIVREATPIAREVPPIARETTPVAHEATPIAREAIPVTREATPTTAVSLTKREATPTQQDVHEQMVSSAKPSEATPISQREATPTQQEATPSQWVPLAKPNFLQRVPPSNREATRSSGRQARLDLSRAKHSIFSSLGAKNVPRPLLESSPHTRSRAKHLKHDHQGKLYVKYPPEDMSWSKIKELFGRYGEVLDLDPHTTDPSIVYVTMDVKGAEEVVATLNGYETSSGHRLVVEKYRTRSPSPTPPTSLPTATSTSHSAEPLGSNQVRLFVKNVSADHSLASLGAVFSRYGRVVKMVPDPKRRNVTYVYMGAEGGAKAINNLHGKAISKNGKPLVVELSYQPWNS